MSIFGQEFDKDWPLQDLNNELTPFGQNLLEKCLNVQKPLSNQITIEQFIQKSNEFPLKVSWIIRKSWCISNTKFLLYSSPLIPAGSKHNLWSVMPSYNNR